MVLKFATFATVNNQTKYYENFITVVAYDTSTNSLWSGSNQCGIAKNYCLTAPGANIIISDVMDDNLAEEYAKITLERFKNI